MSDEVIDFGMWLTTRPGVMEVGSSVPVYAMTEAIKEWRAAHPSATEVMASRAHPIPQQRVRVRPEAIRDAFREGYGCALGSTADAETAERNMDAIWPHSQARADFNSALEPAELSDGQASTREAGPEEAHHKLDTDRQVFFYEQDFYVLSNFSAFNLKWANLTFPTSEHAYHYEKFCFSGDMRRLRPIREAIRTAPSAHEAFKIAEAHKADRRPDWENVKLTLMKRILRAKADQHEYVRRKLLATGDRELIEDSWRDDFWGWGPNRDGQNMLGKLWMEVRSELRALATPTRSTT